MTVRPISATTANGGDAGTGFSLYLKGVVVVKNNNSSDEVLRKELHSLGAREFEVVALTMDADRGLAALHYAHSKGAEHPVAYAIKVFDNPDWAPTNERPRRATNVSVEVECETCGGDRFVLVGTRLAKPSSWMVERGIKVPPDVPGMEEYAVCPDCNQAADTSFHRADGSKSRPLDPAEVRERMRG